jgi:hypothetical protein
MSDEQTDLTPLSGSEWCREVDGCDCIHCRRYVLSGRTAPLRPNAHPKVNPFLPWTLFTQNHSASVPCPDSSKPAIAAMPIDMRSQAS